MTVFVDPAIHQWRGKKWCHLMADTEAELHEFAAKLGLKRAWFQTEPKASHPHYDITENKRKQAVALGAVELTLEKSAERTIALRRAGKLFCAPAQTIAPS